MIAREIVSDEIPPLKKTDTAYKALQWMYEFQVTHLPIVEGDKFIGLLSEEAALDIKQPDTEIGKTEIKVVRQFVNENAHFFEVLRLASEQNLTVIPVLDDQENYVGIITNTKLVKAFTEMNSITEPGGILVLEVNSGDYSLGEIARIIESSNASIVCLYADHDPDSKKLNVTIKINSMELGGVIQAFERFNYTVKNVYQEAGHTEFLKERLDSLMNYLDI